MPPVLAAVSPTTVQDASLLFSVLGVLAGAIVVVALVLVLVGPISAGVRRAGARARGMAARGGVPLAAAIAVTATAGSLWFSEVAKLPPCKLCWFQRTEMYPLAVLLVVAALRRDRSVAWYAVPLAIVGACVSTYHYLIEWHPSLDSGAGCDPTNPCTIVWFRRFGFSTLPEMALCGFLAIMVLTLAAAPPRARRPRGRS